MEREIPTWAMKVLSWELLPLAPTMSLLIAIVTLFLCVLTIYIFY